MTFNELVMIIRNSGQIQLVAGTPWNNLGVLPISAG